MCVYIFNGTHVRWQFRTENRFFFLRLNTPSFTPDVDVSTAPDSCDKSLPFDLTQPPIRVIGFPRCFIATSSIDKFPRRADPPSFPHRHLSFRSRPLSLRQENRWMKIRSALCGGDFLSLSLSLFRSGASNFVFWQRIADPWRVAFRA